MNPEKASVVNKTYRQKHAALVNSLNAKRRAGRIQRTPLWADFKKIEAFYNEAKRLTEETGLEYQVDHVIPLQGETVSGLHVEVNLQVIPAINNYKKHNRFVEC